MSHLWKRKHTCVAWFLVLAICECLFQDVTHDEKCEAPRATGSTRGAALLQTHSAGVRTLVSHSPKSRQPWHLFSEAHEETDHDTLMPGRALAATKRGVARELLPPHLLQLGIEILGAEEVVDFVVQQTREERILYADVTVVTRMVVGDGSNATLLEEGGSLYGLRTLPPQGSPETHGMINMIDLGGNYGVVSIAAFLRNPNTLRAIAVEPIPSTYFLLRWNMWLNGVTELTLDQVQKNCQPPAGILALHNGVASVDWSVMNFCYTPPYTMNAHFCECTEQLQSGEQCAPVAGISMAPVLNYFQEQPITILKMACEGWEASALPDRSAALEANPGRVQRLVGELHDPTTDLQDIACRFDHGSYFVKVCRPDENSRYEGKPLSCGEQRSRC